MFKGTFIIGVALGAVALVFALTTTNPNGAAFVGVGSSSGSSSRQLIGSIQRHSDLPQFRFVDQLGRSFGRDDIPGAPTLIHFFFSTCNGPCPGVTAVLSPLIREFPALRIVSISIDPAHDTPEVLLSYAKRLAAPDDRWLFLNGPQAQVLALAQFGFQFAVDAESKIHSTSAVLFSRRGELLGSFKPLEMESVAALKAVIRQGSVR